MVRLIGIALVYFNCSFLFAETITIGTLPFNPPFEVVTNKQLFWGMEIEIMQQVCSIMKVSCKFKPMNFAGIFKQINTGEIDLGIGSIIIDEARSELYLLSVPYFPSSAKFFVNTDSLMTSVDQLVGKKLVPLPIQFLSVT